jgi:catechol 2,3-dioxygenase-like lactoylglutathione lyase family enzyme
VDGLAPVNLIVTDLARAKEFWSVLGWPSTPRHPNAALLTFPSGINLVLHEPAFARHWDPAYAGADPGSTVVDLDLPSREAVGDAHARIVAAGYTSSVEPWDTFFGARYAIVCDQDGHRIGLKSPQDPSRSYPIGEPPPAVVDVPDPAAPRTGDGAQQSAT